MDDDQGALPARGKGVRVGRRVLPHIEVGHLGNAEAGARVDELGVERGELRRPHPHSRREVVQVDALLGLPREGAD